MALVKSPNLLFPICKIRSYSADTSAVKGAMPVSTVRTSAAGERSSRGAAWVGKGLH